MIRSKRLPIFTAAIAVGPECPRNQRLREQQFGQAGNRRRRSHRLDGAILK